MDLAFHHGVRVTDNRDTPVLIRTAQSAVVFVSGTAPDADATEFPLDRPVLIKGAENYSGKAKKLGRTGTLAHALDAILDQGGDTKLGAYVYIHRVAAANTLEGTISNIVGDRAAMTGVHSVRRLPTFGVQQHYKPRLFVAPGFTGALATAGIKSVAVTAPGQNYPANTDTSVGTVATVVGDGYGAELAVTVTAGAITAIRVVKPGFGYTEADIVITGSGGTQATATAVIGTVGNPVAHEYEGICAQLRAIGFIDGPSTTDEAAVVARECYGSERLYMCDPNLLAWDIETSAYIARPSSARFAGVQCRMDRDIGFHKSVSNGLIHGVDGPARPIQYGEQTNYLNENNVGTVVNRDGGWWTWGNRTTAGTFLAVRRSRDFINEAIEQAYMAYVDRVMNDTNLKLLVEDGARFLRTLEGEGPVMRGSSRLWYDPERNVASEMKQGRITLSIRYESPPPIEDLRVEAFDNIQAYDLLLDRVRGAIEVGPLSTN